MTMNKELLNAFQKIIIDGANENGILLQNEFETKEDFKTWMISFTIATVKKEAGLTIQEAYDFVLGDGSFRDLADSCWEKCQAGN
tara:strand:+ start:50668 stop:50922 length:255 start_codon:yes stop_codon:yes gene_type:complete